MTEQERQHYGISGNQSSQKTSCIGKCSIKAFWTQLRALWEAQEVVGCLI
jgi:hypothetical protein